MRCSTPGMRSTSQSKYGKAFSSSPSPKMMRVRVSTLRTMAWREDALSSWRRNDSGMATPAMNRNAGKMRSANRQPFHLAWRSDG